MKQNTESVESPSREQTGHTPEPWLESRTSNGYSIYARGTPIALVEPDDEETKANASRIVSCVNACAGIQNPAAIKNVISNLRSILTSHDNKELAGWEIEVARKALVALDTPAPSKKD